MISRINRSEPHIAPSAFVAPGAVVLGDVELGPLSSVWYGCVLRGDINWIRIGEKSNIQDGTIIHVGYRGPGTLVGREVVVGHRVVLHSCTVGDRALVGMGSVVMDQATVGMDSLVAAGAVVPPGMAIPPGVLAAGVPAKVVRDLSSGDLARTKGAMERYLHVMEWHRDPAADFAIPWKEP